ncbi:MAG TPA: DUF4832 domain-containing protein [Bryobacteraceae bacterium]|nr:DUF4832 domain-containing protein [Bryobacteraceae bacterium]
MRILHGRSLFRGVCARTAGLLLVALLPGFLLAQERTVVRPVDNGAALVNPGMGWVLHHYDNDIVRYGSKLEPWDTVDDFPGVGVIYLRLAWSYLEPEEGKFNWSVVDIPAQRWIAKGKKIAFRFTTYESASNNPPNATPEWVVKAGARVYPLRGRSGGRAPAVVRYEPDYDDPIFLEKLDNFFAAAAARYDGDPNVAWIDVGTIGIWGEGDPGPERHVTAATVRKHIDLHKRHFKRTLIAYNDNLTFRGKGLETLVYAKEQGLTLRDDSILCRPGQEAVYTHYYAGAFWPRLPVILESEHYGLAVKRGDWGDGSDYLRAIELAHGSYVSVHWWPREFLQENRQLVERITRRMGYRLQLLEASLPVRAPAAGKMLISHRWRNNGVAPCLPGGFVAFTLKDSKNGIAGVFVDEGFDVRTLKVGPENQAEAVQRDVEFLLPPASILKPGTYTVWVSVGSRIGTPQIALPLDNEDGQRRYRIGTITISEPSRS